MLLGIDAMSGWPEAISLKNVSSRSVAQFLATEVITRHGLMELLTSDQGKNLVLSEIIQDLSAILGIQVKTSTAYHPQGNGLIESFHRFLRKAFCQARGLGLSV